MRLPARQERRDYVNDNPPAFTTGPTLHRAIFKSSGNSDLPGDRAKHGVRLLSYRVDETRKQPRTVVHDHHEGHDVAQGLGVL